MIIVKFGVKLVAAKIYAVGQKRCRLFMGTSLKASSISINASPLREADTRQVGPDEMFQTNGLRRISFNGRVLSGPGLLAVAEPV